MNGFSFNIVVHKTENNKKTVDCIIMFTAVIVNRKPSIAKRVITSIQVHKSSHFNKF